MPTTKVKTPIDGHHVGLTPPDGAMGDRPKFQIQMKAAGLVPETVRASDLATLLEKLEAVIVETAKALDIPLAYDSEEALVSLVNVEPGNSSDLLFSVAFPISPAVTAVSQAIVDRDYSVLPHGAQEHLHQLSLHAIKNRWAYEWHPANGLKVAPAIISYEFPVPKPSTVPVTTGQSTLWGNVHKIGGSPPTVILRQRNGKLFNATVDKDVIIEIQAQKLIYSDIGLIGNATWSLEDWTLVGFHATELAEYRPNDLTPSETFRQLGEASRGRWNNVDAAKFIDDLRNS